MLVSYSRIETFKKCPYQYKLRYIDKLKTYPNYDADNPLIIGTALHTGIEKDVKTAIEEYYKYFPIITDRHVEEAIKLETIIPLCKEILPDGEYEHEIHFKNKELEFIGYSDLLVKVDSGLYDLYDFKYSNNVKNYLESGQLHVYKCFLECEAHKKIRDMYFLFAPKVSIRLKKTETVEEFRRRLRDELKNKKPQLVKIDFDEQKFVQFSESIMECENAKEFKKNQSRLCDWCEYKDYCFNQEELNIMNLPKNERKPNANACYKKIWFYGLPFSGKTYLANKFDDVLMLNTDGNTKYIDAPCVSIKDEVSVDGRITRRTFAWDIFKDTILELEKQDNDFKTLVVDLVEDTYEHCRLWCYDHLGIEHESDNSFKAWDFVRTEFLSTFKKLMNLNYNIVLISHEDSSKDITKKSGDKLTAIKPNINDKVALKLAGMVDIVGRVLNEDNKRTISFKTNEVIFGGGRLNLTSLDIPCEYDELMKIYKDVKAPVEKKPEPVKIQGDAFVPQDIAEQKKIEEQEKADVIEQPTTRKRRVRNN